MRKLLIIIFFTTFTCSVFSQEVIRDTLCGNNVRYDVTHLTVTGEIDAITFLYRFRNLPNLTYLDLSQARIVSCKITVYGYNTEQYQDNEIPNNAFFRMRTLKKVILPESVVRLGVNAFSETQIDSIVIPSGVKYIEASAFASCGNLRSISLPDSLMHIGERCFCECEELRHISLPNALRTIGANAFGKCINLSSIRIPKKLTTIQVGTFSGCSALNKILNLDNIDSIAPYAFDGCESLVAFTIPNKISTIAKYTFHNCKSLQTIIIPKSVRQVAVGAFAGCSELTEIHIPEHLTDIGFYNYDTSKKGAFAGCSKLTSFSVAKDNHAFSAKDGIVYNKNQTVLIYCVESINGEVTIPLSVREIDKYAFHNSSINSIIISKNIKEIGEGAFYGCERLTSIKLPKNFKKISKMTFYGCCRLTTIEFPDSLEIIGQYAFFGCRALTDITIPNKVIAIQRDAFFICTGLETLIIPESVREIGSRAFDRCDRLKKISLYWKDVNDIGEIGFYSSSEIAKNCILEVPFGTKDKYLKAEPWNYFQQIVEREQ